MNGEKVKAPDMRPGDRLLWGGSTVAVATVTPYMAQGIYPAWHVTGAYEDSGQVFNLYTDGKATAWRLHAPAPAADPAPRAGRTVPGSALRAGDRVRLGRRLVVVLDRLEPNPAQGAQGLTLYGTFADNGRAYSCATDGRSLWHVDGAQ